MSACASTMRRVGGRRGVRRGVDGLLQVRRASRRGRRSPRPFRGRAATPTGRPAAVARRGRGAGRPPPTRERPLSRRACGFDQPLDDPFVASRLADQQVLGDAFVGARLLGEQLGRTAVAPCALGAGELRVDSAADDRMAERQRPAGLEDPGGRQHVCGLGCLDIVEARQSRRLEQVALLEDRECVGEPPGMLGQPAKPEANRATDVRAPIRSTWRAASAVGAMPPSRSASTSTRIRNGVPRVARRQASTKTGSGTPPSLALDELGDGCLVSGGRRIELGGGIGRHASRAARHPCPHRAGGSRGRARRPALRAA